MVLRHKKLTPDMAKIASKWWADQLRGNAKLDNGDKSDTGAMTFMMASILQSKNKKTPEQIQAFEDALYKRLLEYNYFAMGVDYNACGILVDSAKDAGISISMGCLPWKTDMFFHKDDTIEVSLGYGAPRETIFVVSKENIHSVGSKEVNEQ